jgi:hypothetical protein
MQTAADYMATEMSEGVDMTASNRAKARKAGAKLPLDPDTKTPDYFTAAMRRKKGLPEEAPVNAVGGGNIAGLGVGPQGEPGVYKKKKKDLVILPIEKRKSFKDFVKKA